MKKIPRRTFFSVIGLGCLALLPRKLFGFLAKKPKPSIGDTVCFEILGLDGCRYVAIVLIDAHAYGRDLGYCPHNGGKRFRSIHVFDEYGLFRDEPEVDLVGRAGLAHYKQPDNGGMPQWVITTLACIRHRQQQGFGSNFVTAIIGRPLPKES